MDEKKRLIFTVLVGVAALFFLFTHFCLPLGKANAQLAVEYKQLKMNMRIMQEFGKEDMNALETKIDGAVSDLEKSFPPQEKLNLVEQLTRIPEGSSIVFAEITHRDPWRTEDYEALPVEVSLKASFHDFIKYLAAIEASSLLIGITSLNLRKVSAQEKALEIKIDFCGYRLTHTFTPISKYLEARYEGLDRQRLTALLNPLKRGDSEDAVKLLTDYNPFFPLERFKSPSEEPLPVRPQAPAASSTLSLQGIMRVGDKKVALINNQQVKEGEMIEGRKVLKIEDYQVVLSEAGKEYTLKMGVDDDFIKR